MKDLIKITTEEIGGEEVNTINARELWSFLESKRQFGNWITERIEKYKFVDGIDFCSFNNFVKREIGGSTAKEYHISLDMAKELAMVENNTKGREIRQYFIQIEKQYRAGIRRLPSKKELAQMVIEAEEKIERLEKDNNNLNRKLEQDAHKVKGFDDISNVKGECTIKHAAGILNSPQRPCSSNKLWEFMRSQGIVILKGNNKDTPKRPFIKDGWFLLKFRAYTTPKGEKRTRPETWITGKGIQELHRLWNKINVPDQQDLIYFDRN